MASENNDIEILTRASAATTTRTKVQLDQITFDMERYCHRDPEALSPENLASLMDSLILEGLQVPIEFFRDEKGTIVLLKGHRRVKACRLLAGKNEPGFTLDMEIDAIEVVSATPVDRLIRSISDNEVRLNLDRIGRIRVAKKLYDAGVSTERAARAMGVSVKTYERDVLIAQFPWMFQHVIDGSIAPTHAYVLLAEAEKVDRIDEMREDLDAWIAKKKQAIRDKEKMRKARDNKELSAAEKQVKRFLPNHLVTHWVELLREQKRFDDDAQWNFAAGIETETEQLRISSVSLDLSKAPLDRLAKVASKLSLLTKQMAPYLKKAHQKENAEVAPDSVESPYDLDYLRALGLDDVAKDLEAQTQAANQPDGEEVSEEQPAERQEQDLSQEVQLPDPTPPAPAATPPTEPTAPPTSEPPPPSQRAATGKEAPKK